MRRALHSGGGCLCPGSAPLQRTGLHTRRGERQAPGGGAWGPAGARWQGHSQGGHQWEPLCTGGGRAEHPPGLRGTGRRDGEVAGGPGLRIQGPRCVRGALSGPRGPAPADRCPREPEHVPEARGRPSQHRGLCLWARGACPAPETPAVLGLDGHRAATRGPAATASRTSGPRKPRDAAELPSEWERVTGESRASPRRGGGRGGTSPEQGRADSRSSAPLPAAPPPPAGPPPPGLCPRACPPHPLPPPAWQPPGRPGQWGRPGRRPVCTQRGPLPQGGRSPHRGKERTGWGQAGAPGWGPGSREPAATQPGGRQLPRGAPPGCGYGKGFLGLPCTGRRTPARGPEAPPLGPPGALGPRLPRGMCPRTGTL